MTQTNELLPHSKSLTYWFGSSYLNKFSFYNIANGIHCIDICTMLKEGLYASKICWSCLAFELKCLVLKLSLDLILKFFSFFYCLLWIIYNTLQRSEHFILLFFYFDEIEKKKTIFLNCSHILTIFFFSSIYDYNEY